MVEKCCRSRLVTIIKLKNRHHSATLHHYSAWLIDFATCMQFLLKESLLAGEEHREHADCQQDLLELTVDLIGAYDNEQPIAKSVQSLGAYS